MSHEPCRDEYRRGPNTFCFRGFREFWWFTQVSSRLLVSPVDLRAAVCERDEEHTHTRSLELYTTSTT